MKRAKYTGFFDDILAVIESSEDDKVKRRLSF
jgi:hypothetical protein